MSQYTYLSIDGTLGLQVPEITNYTMVNRTYRYFEGVPLFPFGYGLYVLLYTITNLAALINFFP